MVLKYCVGVKEALKFFYFLFLGVGLKNKNGSEIYAGKSYVSVPAPSLLALKVLRYAHRKVKNSSAVTLQCQFRECLCSWLED